MEATRIDRLVRPVADPIDQTRAKRSPGRDDVGSDEHRKPEDQKREAHGALLARRLAHVKHSSLDHGNGAADIWAAINGRGGLLAAAATIGRTDETHSRAGAARPRAPRPRAAQDWPTRTVRFVVPFGAGSTPDIIARLISDRLQAKLGQTFIVENKAGASGMTGTDAVAKAEPDGHTIGISLGGALAINTLLFSKMPYDPAKEIALITHPDQPAERARGAGEPRGQQRRRTASRC